jgi:DNA-binding transcriptional LysR family regulator
VQELQGKEQPAHDNLLRVSAGIRSCKLWVNPALAALRRSDPEIEVIVDSELLRFYDRLINGEVDLGVTLVDLVP